MARRYLDEFDKGAHSVYLLYGHLVFVTKYRQDILDAKASARVIGIFRLLGKKHGVILEEAKGETDHIHFLIRYKPTTNISQFICSVKSMTSRILKAENLVRTNSDKGAVWSPSYCLLSTGGAPIDIIRKYIENQGKKKKNEKPAERAFHYSNGD